jgi:DNA-binding transcriptional LysR family regulator
MSPSSLPGAGIDAPAGALTDSAGVELRHLRYFVALADTGTFTQAAELTYVSQPTLSQQIRRLEQLIGTPLVRRRRDGVGLTKAGTILLEESRTVLSLIAHGVSRTRHSAGLGRPQLRFIVPPGLPEALTVCVASRLHSAANAAGVDVTWLEFPLEVGFSAIREHRADSGVGWLDPAEPELPDPLDFMRIGSFEPTAWIHTSHPAARRGHITLDELARMNVVHGPRRACLATYDAWLAKLQAVNPHFTFSDPPLRWSLPVTLALTASADRSAAVLTGPLWSRGLAASGLGSLATLQQDAGGRIPEMVPVLIEGRPLTATAGLAWTCGLPRELQQMLFDTADDIAANGA